MYGLGLGTVRRWRGLFQRLAEVNHRLGDLSIFNQPHNTPIKLPKTLRVVESGSVCCGDPGRGIDGLFAPSQLFLQKRGGSSDRLNLDELEDAPDKPGNADKSSDCLDFGFCIHVGRSQAQARGPRNPQ